jgi:hypothetical protein
MVNHTQTLILEQSILIILRTGYIVVSLSKAGYIVVSP